MDFTASGSAKLCSDTLTLNTVTGGLGYHCIMVSGWPLLYWVDHATGDATYLGLFGQPGASGADGWAGGICDGGSFLGTTPSAPEHYYCSTVDNAGKTIVISCTFNSTNQPGNGSAVCVNTTPGSTGKDINSLVAAFTASDTPTFDNTMYGCGITGVQGKRLVLGCGRSSQDTLGWTAVFDPNKVDTVAGCVGGGAPAV